jgi:hypothetical protein
MADATDDGLITEPTLHLCLNEHAIRALATAARKSNLQLIAEQIEAQLPKVAVEEPTEIGSVALSPIALDMDRVLWIYDGFQWRHRNLGRHWPDLIEPEVLRVGVGGPEQPWSVLDHLREVKNAGYIVSLPASTSEVRAAGFKAGVKAERAAAATGIPVTAAPPAEAAEADKAPALTFVEFCLLKDVVGAPLAKSLAEEPAKARDLLRYIRAITAEPTPEQVQAASAPEWARLDASNAEQDAIEALVQKAAVERRLWSRWEERTEGLRDLAVAVVLEVGGQQPGVPVTDEMVERGARAASPALFRTPGDRVGPGTLSRRVDIRRDVRAALEAVLLPKEPTS